MNTAAVTALLAGKEPVRVLVLASEKEAAELADLGLPVNTVDSSLSMQHLASAKLAAERMLGKAGRLQVMTVTREEPQATEAERALIYAMFVRCRKVISCRDKLEDMLKFDDSEGWNEYKVAYENKVLDIFKATWREKDVYPYNIIDNIKEYNKNESYILKQLYWHLAERTPGRINDGDARMINELRQMFSDISISLLAPDTVLVGDVAQDAQLAALAEMFVGKAEIIRL
jgi:hypothetical protein